MIRDLHHQHSRTVAMRVRLAHERLRTFPEFPAKTAEQNGAEKSLNQQTTLQRYFPR
jgi:hypothetical protein